MPHTYFPTREPEIVTWTGEFLSTLQTKPANYFGISADRIAEHATTRTRFVDAYGVANNPVTRTRPTIEAKNVAKKTLVNSTRSIVDQIQGWPQTTNEMRLELGITERGKKPQPSPIPAMPYVKVVSTNGRDVTLSIQQSKTTKRKPKGVLLANVMVHYGETAPETAAGWTFVTGTGRTNTTVTLDGVQEACTAWVTAFWVNGRKETSQAANPIPISLGAMSVPPVGMKIKKAARQCLKTQHAGICG